MSNVILEVKSICSWSRSAKTSCWFVFYTTAQSSLGEVPIVSVGRAVIPPGMQAGLVVAGLMPVDALPCNCHVP
jgi:hypothetical protein